MKHKVLFFLCVFFLSFSLLVGVLTLTGVEITLPFKTGGKCIEVLKCDKIGKCWAGYPTCACVECNDTGTTCPSGYSCDGTKLVLHSGTYPSCTNTTTECNVGTGGYCYSWTEKEKVTKSVIDTAGGCGCLTGSYCDSQTIKQREGTWPSCSTNTLSTCSPPDSYCENGSLTCTINTTCPAGEKWVPYSSYGFCAECTLNSECSCIDPCEEGVTGWCNEVTCSDYKCKCELVFVDVPYEKPPEPKAADMTPPDFVQDIEIVLNETESVEQFPVSEAAIAGSYSVFLLLLILLL